MKTRTRTHRTAQNTNSGRPADSNGLIYPSKAGSRKRHYTKQDRQYLDERELADLLRTIRDPRDLAIFYLASRYGLRASEVGKLRLRELDLVRGTLYIHRFATRLRSVAPFFEKERFLYVSDILFGGSRASGCAE